MKWFKTSTTPRYILEKTENSVNITINSRRDNVSILFFVVWLLAWLFGFLMALGFWSVTFLVAVINMDSQAQGSTILFTIFCAFTLFMLLMLIVGLYGVYVFIREIAGKELITIKKDKLIVVLQFFDWKREKEFSSESAVKIVTRDTARGFHWNPFHRQYIYAFELSIDGQTHRFGFSINKTEAKEIISAIQTFVLSTA